MREENVQFSFLPPEKERLLEIYLKDPEGSLRRLVDALGATTTWDLPLLAEDARTP